MQRPNFWLCTTWAAAIALPAMAGLALAQRTSGGLPPCPPGVGKRLDSDEAKECRLKGTHGGWRILERDGHYDSVVYYVGADDVRDAQGIAQALVTGDGRTPGELLVYIYREPVATASGVRRVSWNSKTGRYDILDFPGRAAEWIVPRE